MIKREPNRSETEFVTLAELSPHVRAAILRHASNVNHYQIPHRILYDYEMIYVTEGRLIVEEGNRSYALEKNILHIMPPGVWHRRYLLSEEYCYYYNVHFDFVSVPENPEIDISEAYGMYCNKGVKSVVPDERLTGRCVPCPKELENARTIRIANGLRIENLFLQLAAAFERQDASAELRTKAKILEILAAILDDGTEDPAGNNVDEIIAKFVSKVYASISSKLDVEKYCHENGISSNYFRRVFKAYSNKSPLQYLLDIKIDYAKELLKMKNYAVKEVSSMVGFEDTHYFSRTFRNRVGASPQQYMEQF